MLDTVLFGAFCKQSHSNTLSILYKGILYKGFFWPVLKILADPRVFSTEAFWAKGFLQAILSHSLEQQKG